MFKLYHVRTHCGVRGWRPRPITIRSDEVTPTGRWKIVATEGRPTQLFLEVYDSLAWAKAKVRAELLRQLRKIHSKPYTRWIHEDNLELIEEPEPPKVTEYINRCSCED